MDQYAEFQVNNVSASAAATAMEELRNIAGSEVMVLSYNPTERILRMGAGGADLSKFKTSVATYLQTISGRAPDTDRLAESPADMDPKNKCITGRDRRAGVSK